MSASRQRVLRLMMVSAALAAGCNSADKIDVGGTCILNSDCNQGLVCTWGKCHTACHTSTDCPAGASCITASDQSTVCQLPAETHCIYASDCQPPLTCAVDQQCRNQCQTDVDCPTRQICTTTKTCAEPNQVDSNKNLFAPDGGFGGSGGDAGLDATAACLVGAKTCACYPNDTCNIGLTCASHMCVGSDAGAGAGNTANTGDASPTGGSARTGGSTSAGGTVIGTGGMGGAVGGTTGMDGGCPAGAEKCSCYGNGTCNEGLLCLSDLCVRPPSGDAAGAGGTPVVGQTVNTGGTPAMGGMGSDASAGTAHDSAVATLTDAAVDSPVDAAGGVDVSASGGASATGGTSGTGGAGGTTSTGGTATAGGSTTNGGATATGGSTAVGGSPATGGVSITGGATASLADAAADSPAGADAMPTPRGTVALFHFDGANGSTVLTDSSGTGKVATIAGNPVISTAQSKFGGASLYVDGTASVSTNYAFSSGGSDFEMEGDFTMDFWIFPISYPNTWGSLVILGDCAQGQAIGPSWNSGGANWHFNPYYYVGANISAPAPSTWHHVAVTRSGLTYRAFVDGAQVYVNTSSTFSYTYGELWVTGCGGAGDNGDLKGYIDELRVVKGVAVWTSDFTPPTAPYTATDLLPPDGGVSDTPAVLDVGTVDASLGDAVPQPQNLMLWLNAATITGLADGANVTTWTDGSGNGKNVSAAGTPPTYRVNQMNGLPIVRFDGSSDELSTAGNFGLSGDPSFTVTLVAKISSSNSPTASPMFWTFDDVSHALTGACLQWSNGAPDVDTGFFNRAYPPTGSFATYADVPSIVTIRHTPGEIGQTTEFFFDGTKQTVTGVSAVPAMTDGLFYVGSWRGQRSIMDVAELLAYGTALTDADRATLECSLGAKYNITVAGCN